MLTLLLQVFVFSLIAFLIIRRRLIYLLWKYPKARCIGYLPIIGHVGIFRYTNATRESIFELMERLANDSGKLVHFLTFRTMMVSKVEHLEVIMTHPSTQRKPYIYDFIKGHVGDSIVRIGGAEWKQRHKALGPTMHPNVLSTYTEDMCKHVEILAGTFRSKVGETFDAMADVSKCIMDMFVDTSLGVDINEETEGTTFVYYADVFLELLMARMVSLVKHSDFLYKWTSDYKLAQKCLDYGNTFSQKILDEKKAEHQIEMGLRKGDVLVEEKCSRKKNFIDHLLDLNASSEMQFTDTDVKSEVNAFIAAGFDTSNTVVSFALVMLGMFPEMQEKVYREVMEVLGPDRRVVYSDLPRFVYLEMFLKETMRLFPSFVMVARVAEDEFQLDGHTVPKGTHLVMCLLRTQRSPDYWKDPLEFDPERWTPEAASHHVKYSYVPFSAGPRQCFGTRLAWLILKLSVATLVRSFRFRTPYKSVAEIQLDIKLTLKAADGILLQLEER